MIASGTSSSWRWIRSAMGATALRANMRAESRAITVMSGSSQALLAPRARITSRPIARKRASCWAARMAAWTAAPSSGVVPTPKSSRCPAIRAARRSATSAAKAAAIASVVASPAPAACRSRA